LPAWEANQPDDLIDVGNNPFDHLDGNYLLLDFYYFVLVCDIAMKADWGIAERLGGRLELGNTIANGYSTCQVQFLKKIFK
jgi:hypothetical protein